MPASDDPIPFQPAPARLPPGRRVYAIGDVHGHLDRLTRLHERIARDLAERPAAAPLIVHLGDYLDRGPDAAGVLARLLDPRWPPAPAVNLAGNHEAMALDALSGGDPAAAAHWLANGGARSLRSWGVPDQAPPADWARHLPPPHLALLRGLALHHREGGYLFVHAGLRPGLALERQDRRDLLWIREPFLSWTGRWTDAGDPAVVVHGHTPAGAVVLRPNRIGLDTGAGTGGTLSCAVLEEGRIGLLQA